MQGTTGYDFLRDANEAAVDPAGLERLRATYRAFSGREPEDLEALQRHIAETLFPAEQRSQARGLASVVRTKALEDTWFYREHPLASLCELGGDPRGECRTHPDLSRRSPATLNATQTHDTKRGEDTRMRINALTHLSERFTLAVWRWREQNTIARGLIDANTEWLVYQTLLGTFPLDASDLSDWTLRLERYFVKAAREAKLHTSWRTVHEPYEHALCAFVRTILSPGPFLEDLRTFARDVALLGVWLSLTQLRAKLSAPGVPDFYQGTELWDLSLVDPDNRRPVDYEERTRLLRTLDEPITDPLDPRRKMKVIRDALRGPR